jgi:protein N-terminal asparagine amidohydrolase
LLLLSIIIGNEFHNQFNAQIGPVGLLYVGQRELAAVAPHDKNVHIIGSDDATSCIIVVVRHTGEREKIVLR